MIDFNHKGREIRIAVIGLGGRGRDHIRRFAAMPDVTVAAVCDNWQPNVDRTLSDFWTGNDALYPGQRAAETSLHYEEILARKDIDAVCVFTSWETHMRIAMDSMLAGFPVCMEIGAGQSLDECHELCRVSRSTGRPVMPMENCCYGETEMAVLNMVKKGLFGEIVHCQGAYEHDLRDEVGLGDRNHHYRQPHFLHRNGELYPTHEMGPIAKYLGINRGNRILTLSSIASKARGLKTWLEANRPDLAHLNPRQGDIVTSMLTCANGETIQLTHDCTLPRPYSRGGRVQGTKGIWMEDGKAIFVEGRTKIDPNNWAHEFESDAPYMKEFEHPLWKAYHEAEKDLVVGGHGGMDYLVDRAWVESVQDETEPPLDCYDAATWMAITTLSEQSVAMGGLPQAMPDFTNGAWLTRGPVKGPWTLDEIPEV
ncbi:MAG: Gfo/Idh/MocA family oxidoreductase [Kiritimatiellae bacterium]|nr:Gfo/Idh/MocA family oxidoreductase [Kiritimatiellia bacterium]